MIYKKIIKYILIFVFGFVFFVISANINNEFKLYEKFIGYISNLNRELIREDVIEIKVKRIERIERIEKTEKTEKKVYKNLYFIFDAEEKKDKVNKESKVFVTYYCKNLKEDFVGKTVKVYKQTFKNDDKKIFEYEYEIFDGKDKFCE